MPITEKAPIYSYLNDQQQTAAAAYHDYLYDSETILEIGSPDHMDRQLTRDLDVLQTNSHTFNERFQPLKNLYARTILMRGLQIALDDSPASVLTSEADGVYIGTLSSAGRVLTTVSSGKSGEDDYRQITFIAAEDEPLNFGLQSSYGTYSDFENLIRTAAKRFEMAATAHKVMQPNSAFVAGIKVRSKRPTAAAVGGKPAAPTA